MRKWFAEDVQKVGALGVDVHVPDDAEMGVWQIATRRPYARWKAQTNAPLPLANLIRDRFLAMLASGRGELDASAFAVKAGEEAGLKWF